MDNSSKKRRQSIRTPKRKSASSATETPLHKRRYRSCEKAGCPCKRPSCFAKAAPGCVKDGYTSRWYHLSNGEHFCNECFEYFYRSYKEGNQRFTDWKLKIAALCQKELSIKLFFAEEILNYWTPCSKCKKWRSAPETVINDGIVRPSWHCAKANGWICEEEESEAVGSAQSLAWLSTLTYLPLLKFSSPFPVLKEYYPDGIGFSALSTNNEKQTDATEIDNFIQPFYNPNDTEKAGCYSPDIMLPDEKEAFPELVKHPSIFLGLRNLVISLWNSNYKEHLSLEKCVPHLVVRGLVRITMCEILKEVLDFLTMRGRVNFGIMSNIPREAFLNKQYFKGSVIVIGAGVAGLAAALQLERAGCQVKVLEARSNIGGRVKDDNSLGICVSEGPQIITGCINNPIYIMCKQIDSPLRILRPKCNLVNAQGDVASEEVDQKIEFYFNLMLESIEELKDNEKASEKKLSLKDCLTVRKDDLEMQIFRELTKEEENLLQFHLANLEYACGASLELVSALNWNQNESMLQFGGEHAWVESGFTPVIDACSKGLDIRLNCEVTDIDYSGDHVKVVIRDGEVLSADKVIVTVPLSILKKESIKFVPALSDVRKASISNLGAGNIEKVMMAFKKNFWSEKIDKADFFGRVPDAEKDRGLACLFYDVSLKSNNVLMALIAGEAVNEIKSLDDAEIVECCLQKLRIMFPDQEVEMPGKYFVSHWSREEHIEMTYSYVGINGSGADYDNLAESIDAKVYFAGEATNRRFPQTVTGAFTSGLREARKILTESS